MNVPLSEILTAYRARYEEIQYQLICQQLAIKKLEDENKELSDTNHTLVVELEHERNTSEPE